MRVRAVAIGSALVVLAGGCGGDDATEDAGGGTAATTVSSVTVGDCLAGRGFGLQPTTTGVSAQTPTGTPFTIAFFLTGAGARAAAAKASGATAIENGVVKASGKRLSQGDLDAIRECIRGSGD